MEALLYPAETTTRRKTSLDGMWKFAFDPDKAGVENGWNSGLPAWTELPVPASFNDFFTNKDAREYCGDFWYERSFFVPGEWDGKELILRFRAVTHRAKVYINGKELCSHEGGFSPFSVNITQHVLLNSYNRVCVKANNELSHISLPAGKTITLRNGKKMNKPYFDFFNYSGINRSVELLALPHERVTDFSVVHSLSDTGKGSDTAYEVTSNSSASIFVRLYDREGNCTAQSEGPRGTLHLDTPRLWSTDDPYLYQIEIQLRDGDNLLDEYTDWIGIRVFEVKGETLLLNRKPVYLKGFGKHEDSTFYGRGFHFGVLKKDFECMKWMGANCFRTSHYPYDEEVYRLADREGILIIDEAAAVGMFDEDMMSFAADPKSSKLTSWFSQPTTPQLLENHLQALDEMIGRDKNHACVIMWSLFNEPETTSEEAEKYFRRIFDYAHRIDPQKRPRTFAHFSNSIPGKCRCYHFSDVISLNRYYGWYVKGGYEISDAEQLFREEMDSWRSLKLDKPFIFTEFGADTYAAEHKLPSVMWSQEYQRECFEMNFRVFDSYSFVKGELIWNFADFQTTEGTVRVNGNKKGIFTREREPKDAAFYIRKRWMSEQLF